MKIRPILGYSAAALTIVVAMAIPFFLYMFFANRVNAMGLHVDELYVAGPVVRTIDKGTYKIDVHKEFHPKFLERAEPFVQLAWGPANALPAQVSDEVDIDGDGRPDLRVSFATPKSAEANVTVNVEPLNPRYLALHGVEKESFTRMIALVNDKVLVRVPLKK